MTYPVTEQSVTLRWVFVPDAVASARTLSDDGIKYDISAFPSTGRARSQLTVSSLGTSDVGRYYCQGGFSNGTLLTRSQELSLFSQAVFDAQRLSSCSSFSGQSDQRTTCVLMAGQVAVGTIDPNTMTTPPPLPLTTPPPTTPPTTSSGGGGLANTDTIILAVVISAVVLLVLLQ